MKYIRRSNTACCDQHQFLAGLVLGFQYVFHQTVHKYNGFYQIVFPVRLQYLSYPLKGLYANYTVRNIIPKRSCKF